MINHDDRMSRTPEKSNMRTINVSNDLDRTINFNQPTENNPKKTICNAENSHIRQIVLWSKGTKIVCASHACLANSFYLISICCTVQQ